LAIYRINGVFEFPITLSAPSRLQHCSTSKKLENGARQSYILIQWQTNSI